MPATDIQEVLAGLKSAQQKPLDMLTKSTFTESMSATSGLTFYDLELGAKFVYPVLTPLRNAIPRVSGRGGLAANWRSVTAINTQNLRFGVSNANRGGVLAVATQDYSAAYKGIGVETSVDFEAQYAGQGFDDVRAVAAKTGLESLMLGEEAMILGGRGSTALGTTPTPTLSDVGTGGSLAANLAQAGSGSTVTVQPQGLAGQGTPLTSDNAGGIVEIDATLKAMWDRYRLSPDTMWVSSQEALNISRKIVSGAAASAQRFVFDVTDDLVGGGIMVRTYLNRFSMQGGSVIDIKVHPNMPAGTLLMTTAMLPYPLAGVGNLMQIRTRQDYYQIEWPLRTRRYEYGIYADEVLQHYFPPALAIVTNIGNG